MIRMCLWFRTSLVVGAMAVLVHAEQPASGVVAAYRFDEGQGDRVGDSSGGHHDGRVAGGATWTYGRRGLALAFNGRNSVRVPSSPALDGQHPVSVTAWVRGRATPFRIEVGHPEFRSPYFQVAGDTIYLATTSDHVGLAETIVDGRRVFTPKPGSPATLWTGTADISLGDWHYVQRTNPPFSGVEPKLQVVGDRIYYEYFGRDDANVRQIWTADARRDGSEWRAVPRTPQGEAEQDDNIQVVSDRVYIGYPLRDARRIFTMWSATYRRDGSGYHAVSQLRGGAIPSLQVAGDSVYYLVVKHRDEYWTDPTRAYELVFARADLDGSNWRVIRTITESHTGGAGNAGNFQISNGRAYLAYSQLDTESTGERWAHLYTASMNLDGTDFRAVQRTRGKGFVGAAKQGLQVVGHRIYYLFSETQTSKTLKELADTNMWGEGRVSVYTAESSLDGSEWVAVKREPPAGVQRLIVGYKGLQIVGAKQYVGLMISQPRPLQEAIGVSGSNIVNKGDAYGLGITSTGLARAFVNAGPDYLFRAEAPTEIGGAIADASLDTERWHHLAMTYDGRSVSLFIDGVLKMRSAYSAAVGKNPFPLVIGDGFQGAIDDVAVYDRALEPREVGQLATASP